nr:aminotransferase class III-fold pyridoxal phosphate-dependent enzyme [Kordiimonas gwangyangensis]
MSRIVLDELDPQDLEYEMDLQIDSDGQTPKHPGHRHVLVPWSVQGNLNPPEIVRGQGSYFFDSSGNRYLDLTSGFVAVSLGHGHPHVIKAIQEQAEKLCWVASSYHNDVRAKYAEKVSKISPWKEGARVHFTSGGAEANDDAIKIAKLITKRPKILSAYRSYHGSTIGASALTGVDRWQDPFPAMSGIVRFFAPYPYRSPFGTNTTEMETKVALQHLRTVISHEGAQNIAALILEPMTGSSGAVIYPDGYLQGLREICDLHGILLIYDEVMTGFGRVGKAFAASRLGVAPDILTFAKGASSSYTPLGGVLVRETVAQHFDTNLFDVGHTHAGHVLAVAGGLAALEVYEEENLFERAIEIEGWLRSGLDQLKQKHEILGDVRGLGALFGIELVKNKASREPIVEWHSASKSPLMRAFFGELMKRGVHAYGRYNMMLIAPPLTISPEELGEGLDAIDAALAVVTGMLE